MAAPMQTYVIRPHYSVIREILAPTMRTPLGSGAMQMRRRWERPAYQFRLQDSHAQAEDAYYLYSFAQYHQGDLPFWFQGDVHDIWSFVTRPIFFGFGDGVRTQFFLNNRYITPGTLTIFGDATAFAPQPALYAAPGLVVFASAPGAGVSLRAIYQCTYKVCFANDTEVLQSEERFYDALFRYMGIVLREVIP